jgi:hypothetical protein
MMFFVFLLFTLLLFSRFKQEIVDSFTLQANEVYKRYCERSGFAGPVSFVAHSLVGTKFKRNFCLSIFPVRNQGSVIAFEVLAHQEDAITHVDTKEQEIQVTMIHFSALNLWLTLVAVGCRLYALASLPWSRPLHRFKAIHRKLLSTLYRTPAPAPSQIRRSSRFPLRLATIVTILSRSVANPRGFFSSCRFIED